MSSNRILGERDVNVAMTDAPPLAKDVKSMEYHRQVLQSRIAQEPYVTRSQSPISSSLHAKPLLRDMLFSKPFLIQPLLTPSCLLSSKQYISPSDTIMSPCTAKLSALRNKQVSK